MSCRYWWWGRGRPVRPHKLTRMKATSLLFMAIALAATSLLKLCRLMGSWCFNTFSTFNVGQRVCPVSAGACAVFTRVHVCITVWHWMWDSHTSVLRGRKHPERKKKCIRGMGSHASIFLNSQEPLEYSPSCAHPYKQMSGLELQQRMITPSYIEKHSMIWKSNGLQPEGCLRYFGNLGLMKKQNKQKNECISVIYLCLFPPLSRCPHWLRRFTHIEKTKIYRAHFLFLLIKFLLAFFPHLLNNSSSL